MPARRAGAGASAPRLYARGRIARRRIVAAVDWPDTDTPVLLASELITNAIRYSGSEWLDLIIGRTADGELHLQVIDEGRGETTPHLRRVDGTAEAGRGLHLVSRCAVRWGFMMDDTGVTVWCDIADTPPPEPRPAAEAIMLEGTCDRP